MSMTPEEIKQKAEEAGYTLEEAYAVLGLKMPGAETEATVERNPNGTVKAPGDYQYKANKTPEELGSFTRGFGGQLESLYRAADRVIGGKDELDTAKQHGAEMASVRGTPLGSLGSTVANLGLGITTPWARATSLPKLLGASSIGGLLEGAQDYGEGKSALPGAVRGAVATAGGNLAMSAVGKAANAVGKRLGMPGRWTDPSEEYLYDFAKHKGVDLRAGDLNGHNIARSMENIHMGSTGVGSVEKQAAQLESALFGNGNVVLNGFKNVDDHLKQFNMKLWEPVYEAAAQGTTAVRPLGMYQALGDVVQKYPNMLNKIDNAPLRQTLADIATAKGPSKLPGLTFKEAREAQQAIGPEIEKMSMQAINGTITKDEVAAMKRIYGAIHGDLTRWGNHGSNQKAYAAYKDANEIYKRDILPFEKNDFVRRWRKGDYDGHNEKLVSDLISPANKTQRNIMLDYLSGIDHDATGMVELTNRAARAASVLARGAPEQGRAFGLVSAVSPKFAIARGAAGAASGRPLMTELAGASADLLPKRGSGALAAMLGLSSDNLTGLRKTPRTIAEAYRRQTEGDENWTPKGAPPPL